VVQKPQEVDPRFEGHCSLVTLVRYDHTRHIVRALRDTEALQSLVSQQFRLIRGVTSETVSVPLVRVTLQSSLCSGSFLCGLATSLPSGIDMLLGNDLCPSVPADDVAVVTRSQTAVLRREADLQTPLVSDPEDYSAEAESDSVDKSAEADLTSLFESSVATDTIPFELIDPSELIRLQQADTSLSSLFELAEKGDDHYFLQRAQCSHCKRCISHSNSVCPSVCPSDRLSVCPSVTRRYGVKTTARSTVQFSPLDGKICLVL